MARETVCAETPASRAMSLIVTLRTGLLHPGVTESLT